MYFSSCCKYFPQKYQINQNTIFIRLQHDVTDSHGGGGDGLLIEVKHLLEVLQPGVDHPAVTILAQEVLHNIGPSLLADVHHVHVQVQQARLKTFCQKTAGRGRCTQRSPGLCSFVSC